MPRNYSESFLLQNWAKILIWINIDFVKIYRHTIYKTDYSNDFSFKHICIYILCRFSDTGIIMTSQRRFYARDLQNHAQKIHNAWFTTSRCGTSLVNFGFIMNQNQIIHAIIGFKHDVSCISRSEALKGRSDTSMHPALRASCIGWSSWPLRASDLTMHDTSCLNP